MTVPPGGGELAAAEALLDLGRPEPARQCVAAVLTREPANPRALRLAARCHLALGDADGALRVVDAAVAADPADAAGHLLRCQVLLALERTGDAAAAARAALALAPGSWSAHLLHGLAIIDLPGQRRAGIAAVRRAANLAPNEPTVHRVQGSLLHALGRHRAARRAYHRALRIDPEDVTARQGLGHLDRRLGRTVSAARHFSGAAASGPHSPGGLAGLERLLVSAAGLAVVAAWLVELVVSAAPFVAVRTAWVLGLASVVAVGYAVWLGRFAVALSPGVRVLAVARLRTDPRLWTRLGCAGAVVAVAAALGWYDSRPTGDVPADPGLRLGVLAATAIIPALAILAVDRIRFAADRARLATRVAPHHGDPGPDPGLDPAERSAAGTGRLALHMLLAAGLAALPLSVLLVVDAPWPVRAGLGSALILGVAGHWRGAIRRARRIPAKPLHPASVRLVPLAHTAVAWTAGFLLVAAYWPGRAYPLLVVLGLAVGVTSTLAGLVLVPVALVRRWRRGR